MKKIIFLLLISTTFSFFYACTRVSPQVTDTSYNQIDKDIQQVKAFFEELKGKKKARTTIPLSDDSLVFYIEADLNIQLGNFSYNKDVVTTEIVDVDIPYSATGYSSTDIENAVNTMKAAILAKYNLLNNSSNPGLAILFVDVELIETTATHKRLRGGGIISKDHGGNTWPLDPTSEFRVWPYYCTASWSNARGYCTDYTQGVRISDISNTIPGWMTIVGKQKYIDYMFPNGLPVMYQNIAIDIQWDILHKQYIGTNPYRPNMPYNQFEGYTTGVCFNISELFFYLNLSNPRITALANQVNKSYLDHYWHSNPIYMSQPPNPVAADYETEFDLVHVTSGKLVQLPQ